MWWNGEAKELSVVFSQIRPISHQKIYSWLETIHPSLLTHLSRLSEPREIPSWPVNKGFLGTSSRPLLYGFFGQRSLIYSTMFHLSARACAGRSGSKVGDKASLWPSFPAPPPFFSIPDCSSSGSFARHAAPFPCAFTRPCSILRFGGIP